MSEFLMDAGLVVLSLLTLAIIAINFYAVWKEGESEVDDVFK